MCGIAGIITTDNTTLEPKDLELMSDLIRHRGPDGNGFLWWATSDMQPLFTTKVDEASLRSDWRLGLAHRRLAIIDVSQSSNQPMLSSCHRFAIIFNGEIYNYIELRKELERLGYHFRSSGDTEVLLSALIEWGETVIPRLVGMFAFAFVDFSERRLLLARDHFGIKPLYYVSESGRFMFASEIKALVPLLNQKPQALPAEVFRFLRYGITDYGSDTLIRQIKRIPPAHWVNLSLDSPAEFLEYTCYWSPSTAAEAQLPEKAQTDFAEAFLHSVNIHLRSDVPIAAALSGGLDSSSVVAAMRQLLGSSARIHSFTYIPEEGAPNEKVWADIVSKESSTIAHYCKQSPSALPALLSKIAYILDEPYTSASMLAQHTVFQNMRNEGIKVSLDGQGADEYLAGYPAFVSGRFIELLSQLHLGAAVKLITSITQGKLIATIQIIVRSLFMLLPGKIRLILYRIGLYNACPSWLHKDYFAKDLPALLTPTQLHWHDAFKGQLREALTQTSLPMLLRYADRNSMHFSIESRLPFLDYRLVDYALSLPSDMLMSDQATTKIILRKGLKNLTATEILKRCDKVGFQTAQSEMLTNRLDFFEQVIRSNSTLHCLNIENLISGFRNHKIEKDIFWRCISLSLWARCFDVEFK